MEAMMMKSDENQRLGWTDGEGEYRQLTPDIDLSCVFTVRAYRDNDAEYYDTDCRTYENACTVKANLLRDPETVRVDIIARATDNTHVCIG